MCVWEVASSQPFGIPCSAHHSLTGSAVLEDLINNGVYSLKLEIRTALDTLGSGETVYTPWIGTAGPNVVEGSPIAEAHDLQIVGVRAESAVMTWRAGV